MVLSEGEFIAIQLAVISVQIFGACVVLSATKALAVELSRNLISKYGADSVEIYTNALGVAFGSVIILGVFTISLGVAAYLWRVYREEGTLTLHTIFQNGPVTFTDFWFAIEYTVKTGVQYMAFVLALKRPFMKSLSHFK